MPKIFFVFIALFYSTTASAFWEAARSATEKAANVEIIADSVSEFASEVSDEAELIQHMEEISKNSGELKKSIQDLGYTASEAQEIMNGQTSYADLASSISRTTRRISRAKNLVKKVGLWTMASPDAVTASQSMEMNTSLREILVELQHQRIDREVEKDKQRVADAKEKIEIKRKKAFFSRQFALMQKGSGSGATAFHPFTESETSNENQNYFKAGLN